MVNCYGLNLTILIQEIAKINVNCYNLSINSVHYSQLQERRFSQKGRFVGFHFHLASSGVSFQICVCRPSKVSGFTQASVRVKNI